MAQSRSLGDLASTLAGTSDTDISFDSGTLYIDSSNNRVGFGTTTPTQIVDIVGSANVSSGLSANNINVTTANVSSRLSANNINVTTANVSTLALSGLIPNLVGAKINNLIELSTISPIAANGTINFDVLSGSILYYTSNSTSNVVINLRGSSTTALNSIMANGESLTIAYMHTNGTIAYFANTFSVDGTTIPPKWQGGTAPTSGNANSVDVYVYTTMKTGNASFTTFASQTQFK